MLNPQPHNMIEVPKGLFLMGSETGRSNEKPVHEISLDVFLIDVFPVTVGQYKKFITSTNYPAPDWKKISDTSPTNEHPIVLVSWHDAMNYCQWTKTQLPTEAQWEYAARGGLPDQTYPWGDTPPDATRANFNRHIGKTTTAGQYPPNGYGLYDMVGNVSEWCLDQHKNEYYKTSPKANPISGGNVQYTAIDTVKTGRVIRGGSWSNQPYRLRVSCRTLRKLPFRKSSHVGFRCVKTFC